MQQDAVTRGDHEVGLDGRQNGKPRKLLPIVPRQRPC
jgi:hypothetical protein